MTKNPLVKMGVSYTKTIPTVYIQSVRTGEPSVWEGVTTTSNTNRFSRYVLGPTQLVSGRDLKRLPLLPSVTETQVSCSVMDTGRRKEASPLVPVISFVSCRTYRTRR